MEQTFAGVRLDPDSNLLLGPDGEVLKLRRQSHDVFVFLIRNSNTLVTRSEIQESVWRDVVVTDDSLQKCIGDIRRLLGADGHEILKTIPRRGFLLQQDVAANKEVTSPVSIEKGKAKQGKLWFAQPGKMLAVLAVIGISGLLLASGIQRYQQHAGEAQPAIAVRSFDNLTEDMRFERLAKGLTAELVASASANKWLRVFKLDGDDTTVEGNDYDIRYILDGTISAEREKLRISSSLIDTRSNKVVWAQSWEDATDNLFGIQDKILESIDTTLSTSWTGVIPKHSLVLARKKTTDSLDAYELFLLAAEHKHRFTREDYDIAERYLIRALEFDPEYGKAWSLLSLVYLLKAGSSNTLEESLINVEKRVASVKQAIIYAPNDGDTLLAESFLRGWQGDFEGAEKAARQAVSVAPNNSDILATTAWQASRRVQLGQDAVEWAQHAIAIHPNPPAWYKTALGVAAFHARDFELAIDTLVNAHDNDPTIDYYLAMSYAHAGMIEDAKATAELFNQVDEKHFWAKYPRTEGHGDPEQLKLHFDGVKKAGLNLDIVMNLPVD